MLPIPNVVLVLMLSLLINLGFRCLLSSQDRVSPEYQRLTWEALKKSLNGIINKVNVTNIKAILVEVFREVRCQGTVEVGRDEQYRGEVVLHIPLSGGFHVLDEGMLRGLAKYIFSHIIFVPPFFPYMQNLVRGKGLFCRSIMKSQLASPTFSAVYAGLVAVVNTKFPEVGGCR